MGQLLRNDPDRWWNAQIPRSHVLAIAGPMLAVLFLASWSITERRSPPGGAEVPPAEVMVSVPAEKTNPRRPAEGERVLQFSEHTPHSPAPVQYTYYFSQEARGAERLAIYYPRLSGSAELFVNGAPIFDDPTRSPAQMGGLAYRSEIIPFSSDYIVPGLNRIEIVATDFDRTPLASPFHFGTEASLEQAVRAESNWSSLSARILSILSLVAVVLAALGIATGPGRATFAWAGLFAASIAGRIALSEASEPAPAIARLGDILLITAAVALAGMLHRESASRIPQLRLGLGSLLAILFVLASGVAGYRGNGETSQILWVAACVTGGAIGIAALIDRFWHRGAVARIEAILSGAFCAGAVGLALSLVILSLPFGVSGGTVFFDTVLTVSIGLCLAGLSIASTLLVVHTIGRIVISRLDLSRLVLSQRAEIARKDMALESGERTAAILRERQRLARDMHDGIGGHLVSLLARVRMGKVGMKEIEDELSQGLGDLRLIVDSLDTSGDDLGEALALFHERCIAQVEAADMHLRWSQDTGLDHVAAGPRWTLNIFRFLQEAVTNAMRHSGGKRLEVKIAREGETMRICVRDDGSGIVSTKSGRSGGRGIANLRHRARALNGSFAIENRQGEKGTEVNLRLPLPTAEPGQSPGDSKPS